MSTSISTTYDAPNFTMNLHGVPAEVFKELKAMRSKAVKNREYVTLSNGVQSLTFTLGTLNLCFFSKGGE